MSEKISQRQAAFEKAAHLCSRMEKSTSDIRKKLQEWKIPGPMAERIIEELKDQQYIDEQRFADSFVREKFRMNGWGRQKIRYMLKGKAVPEAIISKALQQIDEEAYKARLANLLNKKLKGQALPEDAKEKARLLRFASGRGFEAEAIYEAFNQLKKRPGSD